MVRKLFLPLFCCLALYTYRRKWTGQQDSQEFSIDYTVYGCLQQYTGTPSHGGNTGSNPVGDANYPNVLYAPT